MTKHLFKMFAAINIIILMFVFFLSDSLLYFVEIMEMMMMILVNIKVICSTKKQQKIKIVEINMIY